MIWKSTPRRWTCSSSSSSSSRHCCCCCCCSCKEHTVTMEPNRRKFTLYSAQVWENSHTRRQTSTRNHGVLASRKQTFKCFGFDQVGRFARFRFAAFVLSGNTVLVFFVRHDRLVRELRLLRRRERDRRRLVSTSKSTKSPAPHCRMTQVSIR